MLAETCVFDKQSLEPIYCGRQQREPPTAPLIANLRGHFAEFLNHRSPERLRILISPTCVSFSTVSCLTSQLFLDVLPMTSRTWMLSSLTLAISGILTPDTSVVATDISIRTAHFPDAVPATRYTTGEGILTFYPSPTLFSLG